jgi:hypothetical protein
MTKNSYRGVSFVFAISFFLFVIAGIPVTIKSQALPMDKVKALLGAEILGVKPNGKPIYPKGIIAGRYMEDDINGGCKEAAFLNWGGEFHLKKCTYNQPDVKAPNKLKTATVIMLNPEKEVLAKWLVASCMVVKGNTDIGACTVKLAKAVIGASGSQFAIAGIVLEDQRPNCKQCQLDGVQEAYTFRDGVTVSLEDGMPVGFTGMFGADENSIAFDAGKNFSTASSEGPARIQRTTRQQYKEYMGNMAKDVTGVNWVNVVRELYQDAWRRAHSDAPETVEKYRNDLMVASCYSLMGIKPPKKTSTRFIPHRQLLWEQTGVAMTRNPAIPLRSTVWPRHARRISTSRCPTQCHNSPIGEQCKSEDSSRTDGLVR